MNTRSIHRAPALLQVFLHLVALTVCCVLLAPAARAQEQWPARVGRLVEIQGAVRLLDQAENEWISAVLNRPLTTGDHLVTETGSRAELRIGSTTVRLDGRTDLEIRQLDDQAIVLQLNAGSLALKVVSQELLSQVEVLTVEGRFRPRTVGHFRIDRRDDASEATSWRGELDFEGRDSTLQIPVGRRAELWLKGPAQVTHYNWSEVERDSFADWVAYDDTNAERSVTARYVSPEMTGWEDLDRYGNWQTHPEYGAIWIPTAVGVSWAPYRSGHWAWVAPWGWTWVDDARWGFAPFHYGRWVFWNRRWCWTPGPRVHRPPYAPALVGWVGGVEVGVSGHRAAPPVAWVPLGPRDVYRPRADWRDGFDRDGRDGRGDRGNDRQRQPISGQRAAPDALFTNQFVPGAVTAVAGDAFQHRRPVTPVPLPVTAISRQPIAPAAPPAAPPSVRRGGPGAVPSAGDGRGPAAAPLIPPAAPPGAAPARVPPTAGARGGPFNAGPNAVPAAPPAAVPMAPATATPAAPTSNVPHAPPNAVPARPESPAAVPVAPPNAVPTRPEPAARPEIGARSEVPTRRGDPGTRFDPGARQEGNPQREAQNPRGEPDARQERPRPTMPVPHAAPAAPAPVAPAVQPPPAPMPSHRAAPAPTPQPAPQAAPQPAPQPMPPPVPRPAPQPVPHAAPQPAPAPARAAPPAPPPAPAPAPAPRAAPPAPPPPAPAPPAGRKPDNERNPEQRQNPRQNER